MAQNKKNIRAAFRKAVFERDGYRCRYCGKCGQDRQGGERHLVYHESKAEVGLVNLDSHHIMPRGEMPFGGYVAQNGISLCDECHLKAEDWFTDTRSPADVEFHPEKLYELIGSSEKEAFYASQRLGEEG